MTKREYAEVIAKEIGGEVTEVIKNGVTLTGVMVKNADTSLCPVLYVDEAYENGIEVGDMVEFYKEEFEGMKTDINMDWASNYKTAKEMIYVRLMNKKRNQNVDVYRSAKNYGFADLIIVPYVKMSMNGHIGHVRVTNSIMESWGVTKRTVIDCGIRNTKSHVIPLNKRLAQLTGGDPEMFDSPFILVDSGNVNDYGAAGIIKAREELQMLCPDGYYVIPSSIHEVLILPKNVVTDKNYLTSMVGDVNANILPNEEYLSDHVYEFGAA